MHQPVPSEQRNSLQICSRQSWKQTSNSQCINLCPPSSETLCKSAHAKAGSKHQTLNASTCALRAAKLSANLLTPKLEANIKLSMHQPVPSEQRNSLQICSRQSWKQTSNSQCINL